MSNITGNTKFKTAAAALGIAALLGAGYMVINPQFSGTGDILKSPTDLRDYQLITLNNGLKVILVHDKDAKFSSAALNVDVGSIDEPKDWNGLAHLLEHALFVSNEKYPNANEYQQFIRNHGGRLGAITEETYANYHFNIAPEHFGEALDRFSQFIIKPSFNKEAVEKEIQTVDAEYKQSATQDARKVSRLYNITSNPESPFSHFAAGNASTLKDKPEQTVVEAVKAFYEDNYAANRMALVVVGPQSLDELSTLVKEKFAELPKIAKNNRSALPLVYTSNETGLSLSIDPQGQYSEVSLRFPIEKTSKDLSARAYVAHMLSQGEKQGLHSILKSLGWISNMNAFVYGLSREQNEFTVNFQLTEEGKKHVDEITAFTFQYIEFIKENGISKDIFANLQNANEMVFTTAEKNDELTHAVVMSNNFFEFEPKKVITGAYLLKDNTFQPKEIEGFLSKLTPSNLRRVVIIPGISTDKKDELYNVQYAVDKITKADIDAYYIAPLPIEFLAPSPNRFMPENFDLKAASTKAAPEMVSESKRGKLWHLQDGDYKTPKADWVGIIRSPIAYDTKKHVILTGLYALLVADALYPNDYSIGVAGAKYSMFNNQEGITVAVSGFSDKQSEVLNLVYKQLKDLKVDDTVFNNVKDKLKQNWVNSEKTMLFQRAVNDVNTLLVTPNYRPKDLLSELDALTAKDLQDYISEFNQNSTIEMLAHGNITKSEAKKEFDAILSSFYGEQPQKDISSAATIKVVQIPTEVNYQWVVGKDDANEKDTVLAQYFQASDTSSDSIAKSLFLGQLMGAPFYNQMRSIEQVGNQVAVQASVLNDVSGLLFVVQSENNDASKLKTKVNNFIVGFAGNLKAVTDEDFSKLKESLVKALSEKPKNLSDKSFRLWQEISMQTYRFDRQEEVAKAVEKLTKEDLLAYYNDLLLNPKTKRELVSYTQTGPKTLERSSSINDSKELLIEDIQSFKEQATYFGAKS